MRHLQGGGDVLRRRRRLLSSFASASPFSSPTRGRLPDYPELIAQLQGSTVPLWPVGHNGRLGGAPTAVAAASSSSSSGHLGQHDHQSHVALQDHLPEVKHRVGQRGLARDVEALVEKKYKSKSHLANSSKIAFFQIEVKSQYATLLKLI